MPRVQPDLDHSSVKRRSLLVCLPSPEQLWDWPCLSSEPTCYQWRSSTIWKMAVKTGERERERVCVSVCVCVCVWQHQYYTDQDTIRLSKTNHRCSHCEMNSCMAFLQTRPYTDITHNVICAHHQGQCILAGSSVKTTEKGVNYYIC